MLTEKKHAIHWIVIYPVDSVISGQICNKKINQKIFGTDIWLF